jgi:hypothetical protein
MTGWFDKALSRTFNFRRTCWFVQDRKVSTYNIIMDDDKLGLKPQIVFDMYSDIYSKARDMAEKEVRNELRITQDGRVKTRFYIQVSDRMAPHLLSATQKQAERVDGSAKAYFYKLQSQLMAQMFGPQESAATFNIRYEGKLI